MKLLFQVSTDEMASHNHAQNTNGEPNDDWNGSYGPMVTQGATDGSFKGFSVDVREFGWMEHQNQVKTDSTGGDVAHNNIQPSIAAYCWKRTS